MIHNKTYKYDFNWDQNKNPDSAVCFAEMVPELGVKKKAPATCNPTTGDLQVPKFRDENSCSLLLHDTSHKLVKGIN